MKDKPRRYRIITLGKPVNIGARVLDGSINRHDMNYTEFRVFDAERPDCVEITYTPGEGKPDHGKHYRVWVPVVHLTRLVPDDD